jgi:hypothetical protein
LDVIPVGGQRVLQLVLDTPLLPDLEYMKQTPAWHPITPLTNILTLEEITEPITETHEEELEDIDGGTADR